MRNRTRKPSQPPDDSQQLGLELGGDLQASPPTAKPEKAKKVAAYKKHPGRLERVVARDWLESSIASQNGDDECYRNCSSEISRTAFGFTPRQFYKLVGGKPGDRDTLSVEMQNKLMVHELTISPRLDGEPIVGESQSDINNQIFYIVRRQSQETEQFLKERNLYQGLVEKHRVADASRQTQATNSAPLPPPSEIPDKDPPY